MHGGGDSVTPDGLVPDGGHPRLSRETLYISLTLLPRPPRWRGAETHGAPYKGRRPSCDTHSPPPRSGGIHEVPIDCHTTHNAFCIEVLT